MNTSTTTPNLELLRQAVQEFQPNMSRIPFHVLKPHHEFIVMLRAKKASYRSIADLLEKHGVHTSRARVAEYGRIVLDGGKSRKRRKPAKTMPAVNMLAASQNVPVMPTKPVPTSTAPADDVPPPPAENSPYRSRGPHIARVRMLNGTIAGEKGSGQTP
jgi:hypothetical protein